MITKINTNSKHKTLAVSFLSDSKVLGTAARDFEISGHIRHAQKTVGRQDAAGAAQPASLLQCYWQPGETRSGGGDRDWALRPGLTESGWPLS